MAFHKVTNTTKNERRAIFTQEGYVTIEPGEAKVIDVSDDDLKANKDYFKAEKASEDDVEAPLGEDARLNPPVPLKDANGDDLVPGEQQTDAFDGMSDEALRDMIEDRDGKRPHHNTSRAKLLEAARK